jgi:hypothetical protein
MTHLLIIKNSKGEELARVPVTGGYTLQEVPLHKEKPKTDAAPASSIDVGDGGKGKSKVG